MTLREKILAARPRTKIVDCPGIGQVTVRGLTSAQRTDWENRTILRGPEGQPAAAAGRRREMLVIATVTDAKGKPLFTVHDLDALGQVPAGVIEPIIKAAMDVSGIGVEAEIAKNSPLTGDESCSSASPATSDAPSAS